MFDSENIQKVLFQGVFTRSEEMKVVNILSMDVWSRCIWFDITNNNNNRIVMWDTNASLFYQLFVCTISLDFSFAIVTYLAVWWSGTSSIYCVWWMLCSWKHISFLNFNLVTPLDQIIQTIWKLYIGEVQWKNNELLKRRESGLTFSRQEWK